MLAAASPREPNTTTLPTLSLTSRVVMPVTGSTPYSNTHAQRIPKLRVRNHGVEGGDGAAPGAEASSSDSDNGNSRSTPSSTHSTQRTPTPTGVDNEMNDPATDSRQQSPTQEPNNAFLRPRSKDQQTKSKKRNSVMGFLTLKEPSAAAWQDFADAEKEKAKQRGARAANVGVPGVSSQKLPSHVPKVNSKWDGMPEVPKRKSLESNAATRKTNRNSALSTTSRQTNWTAISSMYRDSHDTERTTKRPNSNRFSVQSTGTASSANPKRISPPPPLALSPSLRPTVEESEENKPQTILQPSSAPAHQQTFIPELPSIPTTHELDVPEILLELDAESSSDASEPANSPLTPPTAESETAPALMGIHLPELGSPREVTPEDQSSLPLQSKSEIDKDKAKRSNSGIRRPINFSRPRTKRSAAPILEPLPSPSAKPYNNAKDNIIMSPTLNDSKGRLDPFLTDTFASQSRETGTIPGRQSSMHLKHIQTDAGAEKDLESTSVVSPVSLADGDEELNQESTLIEPLTPGSQTSTGTAFKQPEEFYDPSKSQISLAPSAMSEQWQKSPMERLGLGSKMRRSEVLPWESQDILDEDASRRESTLSPAESKVKRLSWMLGSKK